MNELKVHRTRKIQELLDSGPPFEPEDDEFHDLQYLDQEKHLLGLDTDVARRQRSFNR